MGKFSWNLGSISARLTMDQRMKSLFDLED